MEAVMMEILSMVMLCCVRNDFGLSRCVACLAVIGISREKKFNDYIKKMEKPFCSLGLVLCVTMGHYFIHNASRLVMYGGGGMRQSCVCVCALARGKKLL